MTYQEMVSAPQIKERSRPGKICRYHGGPFVPRSGANPARNWCYGYHCELQRELDHNKQISAAAKRRNGHLKAAATNETKGPHHERH